jgi:hypothetical protein
MVMRSARNMCDTSMGARSCMPASAERMLGRAYVRRPGRACVQERAYVTGLRAANLAVQRLGRGRPAPIIDTEPDELHIAAAKQVNRSLRRSQQALVPALNRASRRVRRSLQTLGLP